MDGPIEEMSEEGQYRSNAELALHQMDSAGFNQDMEKYMLDSVCDHILNSLMNSALIKLLSQYSLPKQDADIIRNDCKQTMVGLVYHLIQSLCQNDSDAWFNIIIVQEPNDHDFKNFLNIADKTDEI